MSHTATSHTAQTRYVYIYVYAPSKAPAKPPMPLKMFCNAHRKPAHYLKQPTSEVMPPLEKLKKEIAYDPNREARLALAYAREKDHAALTDQRQHMLDAGQLIQLNVLARRPTFVEETSAADTRGPSYKQQVRTWQALGNRYTLRMSQEEIHQVLGLALTAERPIPGGETSAITIHRRKTNPTKFQPTTKTN